MGSGEVPVLLERTFQIGGAVLGITGILFLVVAGSTGLGAAFLGLVETGGILFGFGVFFWFVGRDARASRLELLDLPKPPPPH